MRKEEKGRPDNVCCGAVRAPSNAENVLKGHVQMATPKMSFALPLATKQG